MASLTNNDTLINYGTITTTGDSADGMLAHGGTGNNVLANHGTITVSGTDAHGIKSVPSLLPALARRSTTRARSNRR